VRPKLGQLNVDCAAAALVTWLLDHVGRQLLLLELRGGPTPRPPAAPALLEPWYHTEKDCSGSTFHLRSPLVRHKIGLNMFISTKLRKEWPIAKN
jgi:hypothetical protein